MAVFGLNKKTRNIKYCHKWLNWHEHVCMLQHTRTFASHYHMRLPTFFKLINLLRPKITIDVLKSMILKQNNDPIYSKMVVWDGLKFLGGSSQKGIEDIYG